MREKMKSLVLVVLLIVLVVAPLDAAGRWIIHNGERIWLWTRANDAPRVAGGLHSWEAFKAWFLDPRAQYDLNRIGLPEKHRQMLTYMVQKSLWGQQHRFRDGEVGELAETTVLRGTRLDHLTFKYGQVISPVLMNFSAEAWTISVTDRGGLRWYLHTFKVCGNAGDRQQMIVQIIPPSRVPGELPPNPIPHEEVERYYWVPTQVPIVQINRATDHSYQVRGIFTDVANILGRWLGATKINLTSQAFGGNPQAFGGQGGLGGQGGAGGNSTNTNVNQNQNFNPISIGIGIGQ
ncbi:hypothetical protein HY523_02035 [Candidatus Berkelbacteria bacterium]|nr:hypothetical protein [Candidatus Berkelbacteria bacterium]